MELYEALRTRRSRSAFESTAPPRDLLERIIEAATWAPNHHLTEPWRFHVLTGAARGALARAAWGTLPAEAHTEHEQRAILAKLERSPVVIVITQHGVADEPVRSLEDYAACACATQNLLLAAHAEGLAAKWSTGKLALSAGAAHYLGLEARDRIVAFVYVGYAAPDAAPRGSRRSPAAITWHEQRHAAEER
ncbi:MAG: nitroreductase [Chloroflexi bacterium]|nr:nitroreductase [Chloroflexota bacterium]